MLDIAQARDAIVTPSSPNKAISEEATAAAVAPSKAETTMGSRHRSDSLPPGAGAVRKKQKMYTSIHPTITLPDKKAVEEVKLNFAQRLMELLEMDDVKPHMHWCDDGLKICIEDPVRFAEEMLPKYFSDTKYKSFMVRIKRELDCC